ncbi:diguanylate cyclase [Microcella daejeonensis]|uniref:diguanylate cyclase domain-containing protein n=1 Tax=Microcella daejeonensis TaxID=2994971 RepID=UPI0022703376|nr:diguanylate cyclase [Microcella daejeonensis]WAB82939.1 diguanylate cyclase [Microcella daejeonensis]
MSAVDVRARFWDAPAVSGRAIDLSVKGAQVFLPWTPAFSESDALTAYAARSSLQIGSELSLPCVVRWVSGGRDGLDFGVEFDEVPPDALDALTTLTAAVSTHARENSRQRAGSARRLYLRVPRDEPARLRRLGALDAPASAAADGEWRAVRVVDVSASGCRLRGRRRLRPGERVEIELASNPGVPLIATVRWSRRSAFRALTGLEFADADSHDVLDPLDDADEGRAPAGLDEARTTSPSDAVRLPERAPVSTALLARALESVSEGSLITDRDGMTIYANAAFTAITGYGADDIIGSDCRLLQGPDSSPETVRRIGAALRAKEVFQGEILNYRQDGTPFWNLLTITPIIDDGGEVTHFVSVQRDVTELVEQRRRLSFEASHDALTGLLNRAGLRRRLTETLLVAQERETATAVVLLDLDRFKPVNDRHGHVIGDGVLIEVAARMTGVLRRDDMVARLGGDEFVLVLDDLDPSDALARVAGVLDRLHAEIARPIAVSGGEVRIDASAGIAVYPADGRDARALFHASDQALYRAKARPAGGSWWVAANHDAVPPEVARSAATPAAVGR